MAMTSLQEHQMLLSGIASISPWSNDIPSMNEKRQCHAAVAIDKFRFMVIGGNDGRGKYLRSVEIYNTKTNEFKTGPSLNQARSEHAAVFVENKIYVFGGCNYDDYSIDSIECLDLSIKNSKWKLFSVKNSKWKMLKTKLTCNRNGCTAAVVGHLVYIIGGEGESSVDILDTRTDTIRKGASMTTNRWGSVAGVVGSTIYVFGGYGNGRYLATIECLNVAANNAKWKLRHCNLSGPKWFMGLAVVGNDCCIIAGGHNGKYCLLTAEIYDPKRDVCIKLPNMTTPRNRPAAVALDNTVYVMGGYNGSNYYLDSMEFMKVNNKEDANEFLKKQGDSPDGVEHVDLLGFDATAPAPAPPPAPAADSDSGMEDSDPEMSDDGEYEEMDTYGGGKVLVERAGLPVINGTFEQSGTFDGVGRYVKEGFWKDRKELFSMFRCNVSDKSKRWYISIVPDNRQPGMNTDIDFYSAPAIDDRAEAPPATGWVRAGEGVDPAPKITWKSPNGLLTKQGDALYQKGQYYEALKKYKEALNMNPVSAACWSNLAACHEKLGQHEEMVKAATKCLELDGTFDKGYYQLATAQKALGDIDASLDTITAGLTMFPDSVELKNIKAELLATASDPPLQARDLGKDNFQTSPNIQNQNAEWLNRVDSYKLQRLEAILAMDDGVLEQILSTVESLNTSNIDSQDINSFLCQFGKVKTQALSFLEDLSQHGALASLANYQNELQSLINRQQQGDADIQERRVIYQRQEEYDFYLHMQWKLRSMIMASECLACGMVEGRDSFREGIKMVVRSGIPKAFSRISFVKTVSKTSQKILKQFQAIPGTEALTSVVAFLLEFADERRQHLAVCRVAVFSTLLQLQESNGQGSLTACVERVARLLVRARDNMIQSQQDSSKWKPSPFTRKIYGSLTSVFGDIAANDSSQQGLEVADKFYKLILNPPVDCVLYRIFHEEEHDPFSINMSDALVASLLRVEIEDLNRFERLVGNTTVANEAPEPGARNTSTKPSRSNERTVPHGQNHEDSLPARVGQHELTPRPTRRPNIKRNHLDDIAGPVQDVLELPGYEIPEMRRQPYVFLSHTGQDGIKASIARPTHWFLTEILCIDAFLDEASSVAGAHKIEALIKPAYECTHALLILSPSFIQRRFCVMELNTFMKRLHKKDGIDILLSLYNLPDLTGYAESVMDIIYFVNSPIVSPVDYMVLQLWPSLAKKLGKPAKNRARYEDHLAQYIRRHRGEGLTIPQELEVFSRRYEERLLGGNSVGYEVQAPRGLESKDDQRTVHASCPINDEEDTKMPAVPTRSNMAQLPNGDSVGSRVVSSRRSTELLFRVHASKFADKTRNQLLKDEPTTRSTSHTASLNRNNERFLQRQRRNHNDDEEGTERPSMPARSNIAQLADDDSRQHRIESNPQDDGESNEAAAATAAPSGSNKNQVTENQEVDNSNMVTRKEFSQLRAQVQHLNAAKSKEKKPTNELNVGGGQTMAHMHPLEAPKQVEKLETVAKNAAINSHRLDQHAQEIAQQKDDTYELRRDFEQTRHLDRAEGRDQIAQMEELAAARQENAEERFKRLEAENEKLERVGKNAAINTHRLDQHAQEIAQQKDDTNELRRNLEHTLHYDRIEGLERFAQVDESAAELRRRAEELHMEYEEKLARALAETEEIRQQQQKTQMQLEEMKSDKERKKGRRFWGRKR